MTNPLMDGATFKRLTTPDAIKLAELYLIAADLVSARAAFGLYFEKYAMPDRQGDIEIISKSLFRDGVLLYCSCFSTTDHNKLLPSAVYGHLDWGMEYYQTLLDMRDSFVAHNFGPQRQHTVILACHERAGELHATATTQIFVRFAGWTTEEAPRLLPFVDGAIAFLNGRIAVMEGLIVEYAASLAPDEIAALPDAELSIPNREDFRMSRAKFRDKDRGRKMPLPEYRLGRTAVIE